MKLNSMHVLYFCQQNGISMPFDPILKICFSKIFSDAGTRPFHWEYSQSNLKKISKSLKEEQKKYNILLSGGDTVFSKKLSFTIISIGFSKKIVLRNKAKLYDDIYVTGNLGDSFAGLLILKKKINVQRKIKEYFLNRYYLPDLQINLTKKLYYIANTSIDVSDCLIADLEKLINNQRLSYKLNFDRIPISKKLKDVLISKKLSKLSFISKGDDYQILFTASPSKSRIIEKIAKFLGLKISKIGKICNHSEKSQIIDKKGNKINLKLKGYYHQF